MIGVCCVGYLGTSVHAAAGHISTRQNERAKQGAGGHFIYIGLSPLVGGGPRWSLGVPKIVPCSKASIDQIAGRTKQDDQSGGSEQLR